MVAGNCGNGKGNGNGNPNCTSMPEPSGIPELAAFVTGIGLVAWRRRKASG